MLRISASLESGILSFLADAKGDQLLQIELAKNVSEVMDQRGQDSFALVG